MTDCRCDAEADTVTMGNRILRDECCDMPTLPRRVQRLDAKDTNTVSDEDHRVTLERQLMESIEQRRKRP